MFNVLDKFGFGQGFIEWIRILSKNITASVIQAREKSEFFKIERGWISRKKHSRDKLDVTLKLEWEQTALSY